MFRSNSFLVLGRAGMDLYADPPGAAAESAERFTTALGGSAANIAAGITRLGGKAALITSVSNDSVGRFVLKQLRRYNINTDHVETVDGEKRTSLAIVETRLENCQNTLYRNEAADFALSPKQTAKIDWSRFAALIVTGTALAKEPSRAVTFDVIKMAAQNGLTIVLDVDYRPYSWTSPEEAAQVLRHAADLSDIVIGNDVEFDVMAKGEGQTLAEHIGQTKIAVYKMGEKGAITFSAKGKETTDIFKVNAIKPTGAGDAFMAGFVTSLANGSTLDDAVRRGAATAAIVVARVGCAPAMPTETELTSFLSEHG